MIIEPRPVTDDDLVGLVDEQERELAYRYGVVGAGSALVDPEARFMVAVVGRTAVGCGAIQPLDPVTVELKRMYVRPDHRGRGWPGGCCRRWKLGRFRLDTVGFA